MDDASAACEDLKFFERRLTEVIGHMQPKATKWRVLLVVVFLSTVLTSYQWIVDPTLRTVSLRDSLANHPIFSLSLPALFILFASFGIHRRVVAPSIIASRCREALATFSLSCDEHGKLIVKPAIRSNSNDVILR